MSRNNEGQEALTTRRKRRWAAEQEAQAKEAQIQKMLKKRPKEDARLPGTFGHFGYVIQRKAPKLLEKPWLGYLRTLETLKSHWIESIDTWKPKGKSPRTRFRSLVRHLLVKYPVPEWLLDAFAEGHDGTRRVALRLLVHLAQGGSLYKAVKGSKGGIVTVPPILPVPLTKRMCRELLTQISGSSLAGAIRATQVKVHGGDRRLVRALCEQTRMGSQITGREEFYDHLIQWLCQQPMLNPHEVGPIVDWAERQRAENAEFSMKGRTGVSVMRAVEEWHGNLAKLKNHQQKVYDPCGIPNGLYERKINLPSGGFHMEEWAIVELLSSRELHAEGAKMGHCVFSYSRSIEAGTCAIYSLRIDGTRTLTIEVSPKSGRVVQIRGKHNRMSKDIEMRYINLWAQENALEVRNSRW